MKRIPTFLALVVLFMHWGIVVCAETAISITESRRLAAAGEPIMIGDRVVFSIKGLPGYPAQKRVQTINSRIRAIAENTMIDTASITTITYKQPITFINAKDEPIMVVFDDDARMTGMDRDDLADKWSMEFKEAIDKYRHDHSRKGIIASVFKTIAATVILILIILVLNKVYRKVDAGLQSWMNKRKISIHIQSFELLKAERLMAILLGLLNTIRIILILIIFYSYIHNVLVSFPWTRPYASQILQFVIIPFKEIGRSIWKEIPDLFFILMISVLAFYVVKLSRMFFIGVENGTITFKGFYPEWAPPTYRICRLLIIVTAAIMAFPYIPGSNSPAFKGISIFFGVLLSLGSTSFVSNILAGYSIIYRRAFKEGDRVKIADFMGDVTEIRLQVTHLRTIKNEEIVVPNSMIVNSHVINFSSLAGRNGLILHTKVTIGYDTPWRQVHALLLMAAEKTPGLKHEPGPYVLQTSLDDFYVSYELNAYCYKPSEMTRIYSDLHKNIQDAFNEYGVQIMSPSYRSDPDRPKVVPKEQWYPAPAKSPDNAS